MKSREVVLARPVEQMPTAADFRLVERRVPPPQAGELRVEALYLSLDPYIGGSLRGRHMGAEPRGAGASVPGECVARVLDSGSADFRPGDLVAGEIGWREVGLLPAQKARRLDPRAAPSSHLSILGMPGLTAWAGVSELAAVGPGDVFTVDAAAGAVGGVAGQLARLRGARAFGIAGGPDKCALVRDRYGFEDCFDYKSDDWLERLDAAVPEGPTAHFENVGASILTPLFQRLRLHGRVVLCGLAEHYQAGGVATLPVGPIIGKRARVIGLVVYDHYPRWQAWIDIALPLVQDGRLTLVEDVAEGLEAAPAQFERLMRGENRGKTLVRLAAGA